jgi:hypothetical protein
MASFALQHASTLVRPAHKISRAGSVACRKPEFSLTRVCRSPVASASLQTQAEVVTDATYQDLVLSCPVPAVLIFWEEK